jgi:hypothetical protein
MCVRARVYIHVFRIRTARSCVRKWHMLAADAYACTDHVKLDVPAMHRKEQRPINKRKNSYSVQLVDRHVSRRVICTIHMYKWPTYE